MRRFEILSTTLLLGCLVACSGDDRTAERAPSTATARRNVAGTEETLDEDLDLQAMLAPVPEYEGQGRNLFAFGPIRRVPPPSLTPTTTAPPVASNTTTVPPRTVSNGPAARVNVKYAGFVEKTEQTGQKSKYAILLDGNEILALAEGDTLTNRFTVVEIGLESVTVSAEGSSATQRIPLQSN
jgi:hypothetical protein